MFEAAGTDFSFSEFKNHFEGLQTSILKELSRMETAMSFLRRRQYEFPKDSNRFFQHFEIMKNDWPIVQNPSVFKSASEF